ncbi:hypothetical protein NLG97_g9156 [Lecanicillium saksenae]|uniref:Uncharacterized protein n=1 Tax=Lecanicillium saksenae TaxID=468837 RepID=A0ACC1QKQ6_9HYPO|nr:hypothetical protein NLG97_g9156 [Lecanicillium saksenae]
MTAIANACPPPSAIQRLTFTQVCPATRSSHSFTMQKEVLLSAKRMEDVASKIRWSDSLAPGDSMARSRALMEMVHNVIAWEKGLLKRHPLIEEIGPFPGIEKKQISEAGIINGDENKN